ncbi:putative nuclear export mediator factor NEMF [Apostichopus japonicus]|uniref:Putative nuclear export mediator factor NEMF n=1 Tax=Stichopus japonicus TaxID=307972 RepID=A0A2G8KKF6_STIJA|nr:putative nuclear export mediator factor NEMF [Apostichopus japonicus]
MQSFTPSHKNFVKDSVLLVLQLLSFNLYTPVHLYMLRVWLLGLRVANIYDINNKTYLIRLTGQDVKEVLLLESGFRVHMTSFDWPKNNMPSNFSMKLRKHIRGRRLESIRQLGMDRAVDMQFGSNEAAYHLLVEIYDRGNIALTDHEYTILNVLRARSDGEDVRFAVREKYPLENIRQTEGLPDETKIKEILLNAKPGQNLKKILNPNFVFGPALIEHCLLSVGFPSNAALGKDVDSEKDAQRIVEALTQAQQYLQSSGQESSKGYIIQRKEKKPSASQGETEAAELLTFFEFHPFLFKQFEGGPYLEFPSFTECLDEFFSKQEGQKLDMKALQQEKDVLKKLDNVKKDQERRINSLQQSQTADHLKGELIEMNLPLVDEAIRVVRSAIANQIDWKEIDEIIKDAQKQGDLVAKAVKSLKLEMNHMTLMLQNPYSGVDVEESDSNDSAVKDKPIMIDIDLGLSAYANARKYFDMKKHSRKKEQKTKDAATKAIKSAEKKTKQALKDVAIVTSINKTRKTYWFEKFFWFISSENFLVIAGRDKQQNEIVYKRYLRPGDIYVHADLHGASSVIIKNHTGGPIPPKTLNEAGAMAVCFSVAWEAKVITSAWWVNADQVSKTAPTGEYLSTGSFMIRGKKNYLPPVQLMMGFGFLFKVEDTCVWRHKGERKVWAGTDEDVSSFTVSSVGDFEEELNLEEESEVQPEEEIKDLQIAETKEVANEGEPEVEMENVSGDDSLEAEEEEAKTTEEKVEEDEDENELEEDEKELEDEGEEEDGQDEGKDSREDGEFAFPDTSIDLQHVTGTRSRGTSMLSVSSKASSTNEEEVVVYLGDKEPLQIPGSASHSTTGKKHFSAKQRRELKKKKQGWTTEEMEVAEEERIGKDEREDAERKRTEEKADRLKEGKNSTTSEIPDVTSSNPVPLKRGQKHKLKKMRQKYRDQDEEERRLKMELLASSGVPKDTKVKKGKKAKHKNRTGNNEETVKKPQPKHQQLVVLKDTAKAVTSDETLMTDQVTKSEESTDVIDEVEKLAIKDESEETIQGVEPVEVKHHWKDKGEEVPSDDDDTADGQLKQSRSYFGIFFKTKLDKNEIDT